MDFSDFWTAENIASAVPWQQGPLYKTKLSGRFSLESSDDDDDDDTVPIEDRTEIPYNSVGALLFMQGDYKCIGTAYAVNIRSEKNIVITAAHNLIGKEGCSTKVVFVPAVQSDDRPGPYGVFQQVDGGMGCAFAVHPSYDVEQKFHDPFDIGVLMLKPNRSEQNFDEAGIPLLEIAVDQNFSRDSNSFLALGYPEYSVMKKKFGCFIGEVSGAIVMEGGLPRGCSGGPWLNEDNKVIGNTAAGNSGYDFSPYYSTEKISQLLSRLKLEF